MAKRFWRVVNFLLRPAPRDLALTLSILLGLVLILSFLSVKILLLGSYPIDRVNPLFREPSLRIQWMSNAKTANTKLYSNFDMVIADSPTTLSSETNSVLDDSLYEYAREGGFVLSLIRNEQYHINYLRKIQHGQIMEVSLDSNYAYLTGTWEVSRNRLVQLISAHFGQRLLCFDLLKPFSFLILLIFLIQLLAYKKLIKN